MILEKDAKWSEASELGPAVEEKTVKTVEISFEKTYFSEPDNHWKNQ